MVIDTNKFQFVECTVGVLLVVLTPLYAPLSYDKGAFLNDACLRCREPQSLSWASIDNK